MVRSEAAGRPADALPLQTPSGRLLRATVECDPTVPWKFRYKAFITYSHRDRRVAQWLHRAIENYRVPKTLVSQPGRDGPIPENLFPLFRDRDELSSSPDLSASIREALAQSGYLIVICSPTAAKSRWVNEEIIEFKRLGRSDRVHGLIVDGDPSLRSAEGGCYPPAFCFALDADGKLDENRAVEPLAADIRPGADGKNNAKLKLIGGLLGIPFNALRQREIVAARQRQRKIRLVAGLMALLAILGGVAAYLARSHSGVADLRQIPGVRVEKRETTLDLSGWQETTAADIANRVKKSLAVSRNKFTVVRTHEHATNFIHLIGTTSGIRPEVDCSGRCRMVPRDLGRESRAPNEFDLEFNISTVPLDQRIDFAFNVSFWNAFQEPKQWWGGFRVLHATRSSVYSIRFPDTRRPHPETLEYVFFDKEERPYDEELRTSLVKDDSGRVIEVKWEVPHPSGDRSYRVKWDWSK
jgi:Thoeris protein ThsB, TIR-like domain